MLLLFITYLLYTYLTVLEARSHKGVSAGLHASTGFSGEPVFEPLTGLWGPRALLGSRLLPLICMCLTPHSDSIFPSRCLTLALLHPSYKAPYDYLGPSDNPG